MDIIGFIPQFGGLLYTLLAFVVALSVIVAVHEYGHYIVGRWSGIHAEVFSLGFGPVLFSRVDKHGTRWQIAALPVATAVLFGAVVLNSRRCASIHQEMMCARLIGR